MAIAHELKPGIELAKLNGLRFPHESADYRQARDALLGEDAEEIELRRRIERVAEKRPALRLGGRSVSAGTDGKGPI